MKKKLLVLLMACMMLGACTDAGQTGNVQSSANEVNTHVSGEVRKLGASGDREIVPVELRNQYEKAAYLADLVYKENLKQNEKNVLVSPLSLNVALGMATEGTSGETAKELYRYLGGENYAEWVNQYMTFAEGLKSNKGLSKNGYDFNYKLANSIWVREGDTLKSEYQKLVKEKFRAEAQNVNFVEEAEATARKINSWCDKNTEGLIKEVVKPEMFSPELAAILVNSVYFESPWIDSWYLTEHEFTNLEGKTTKQEMLGDSHGIGSYFENEYCTAFSKSYYNGFEFIGILPKAEGEFQLSDLDLESLMASRSYDYDVRAIMPKLNYETTASNIVDILMNQGVLKVFDASQAEFDRMIENRKLYISDIIQKCKIELDEDGTKAAAVTVIMTKDAAAIAPSKEKKEVNLDRPFAYLIYDSTNDQIVFAGKVTDIQ